MADTNKPTKLEDALKDAFKSNPDATALHQTADGQCFTSKEFAKLHAKDLENKVVKSHTRDA